MIKEAILFSTVFTGGIVGLYRSVLYFYHRKIKENQALISITKLDADLWKLLSRYIRLKDADWRGYATCFTCGKQDDWRSMDAGHFIPKATTGSYLKFLEKNIHVQCIYCNRTLSSNPIEYEKRMKAMYGDRIVIELNKLREQSLTITDYQTKIKYYKQCLKSL